MLPTNKNLFIFIVVSKCAKITYNLTKVLKNDEFLVEMSENNVKMHIPKIFQL